MASSLFCALLACGEGGSNPNEKGVGDGPGSGGVQLELGDIAVAPTGDYVLFQRDDGLAVGWPSRGVVDPIEIGRPNRLVFSKTRAVVYVASSGDGSFHAIDVRSRAKLWSRKSTLAASPTLKIAVTHDDDALVATSGETVEVLDVSSGAVRQTLDLPTFAVDLRLTPDGRALIVQQHSFSKSGVPSTVLTILDSKSGDRRDVTIPNCSDRIAVLKDGSRAFLAPTTCSKDPVSVIELEPKNERFNKNLPGFGPVTVSADGSRAIAFLDMTNIEKGLFDDPSQIPSEGTRYHLMVIDAGALTYEFAPVGDDLPRYALTPNGNVLLVDTAWAGTSLRLFDTHTRAFRELTGPSVVLENFVLSSDSNHAYALYSGLIDVDLKDARSVELDVPFAPRNINIAPDDRTLYLRKDARSICVYSIADQRCDKWLEGRVQTPTR